MPKVNFQRKEYTELAHRWQLIRDVISGAKAVKDRGTVYLPKPNAEDTSDENSTRYDQYKTRAVFYGVTGRTLRGLIGQVFARLPVVAMPPSMDVLKTDVSGAGISLNQQARKALGLTIAHGRCGLLVDYPKVEQAASVAQLQAGDIRPIVTLYDPWDIINWRVVTVNGKTKLSLVVISEKEVTDDDGFEQEVNDYYRVLRLRDGTYWSEIWYFDEKVNDFVLEGQPVQPLDAKGKPWKEIPFTFIGSENNDPQPDLPPLYDMAELNIGHYRNSADYEESCFIIGQPTPVLAGLTENWVSNVLKGEIQLGSRAAVPLPEGASASLLQATPNSMVFEAMQHKERQMVALGAKLVEQQSVQRTAMEAGMEEASTSSLLSTIASNVSAAYTQALTWAGLFLGTVSEDTAVAAEGDTLSYELNTDFDIATLPAAEVAGVIAAWQANAITDEEMRDKLKRGGWAYLDDEEWKGQVETANLAMGLPADGPVSAATNLREQAAATAAAAAAASTEQRNQQ